MTDQPAHSHQGDGPSSSHTVIEKFAPLPYQSLDPDGVILSVNQAWCDLLGYDRDAVEGEWFGEFLSPGSVGQFESRFPEFKSNGGVSGVEFTMVRANGDELLVSFSGNIEFDKAGTVVRTHCQFRDITDRNRRENKLQRSQRAFEDLFNGVNDAVFVHELSGPFVLVNETAVKRLGYTEDELLGMGPADLDAPSCAKEIDERRNSLRETGSLTFETIHVTKSGGQIPVEISSSLIDYYGREAVLSVARDISERKAKEQNVELFRTLVDQAGDSIFVVEESTGELVDANQTACEKLGYEKRELTDLHVADVSVKFDDREAYRDHLSKKEDGTVFSMVDDHVRADGSTIPVEVSARSLTIGEDVYRIAVARDISRRIEREQKLRRMKRAVDASAHAIYVTDVDGTIEYANAAFEQMTGYPSAEAVGKNPRILNSGEMNQSYFERLWETVLAGEVWEEEVINRQKSGTQYHAHQTIAPITDERGDIEGFVAIQTDITDRKRRENQLAKRERILRELHATNQTFLAAEDMAAVYGGIIEALSNALDFDQFAVLRYDPETGRLVSAATSGPFEDEFGTIPQQEPGKSLIWEIFSSDESQYLTEDNEEAGGDDEVRKYSELLVVPIQGHGVILVPQSEGETIETVDIELIELLAANARAMLSRLTAESSLGELSQELSVQQSQIKELESVIKAFESIQKRLTTSDTKEAIHRSVCEELVAMDFVDFAWIGQPEARDCHLTASVWAGRNRGFLDAVSLTTDDSELPSQRAADQRQSVFIQKVSDRAATEPWAADALSRQFNSVLSVPLLHDEVLYGVLTMYSETEAAFNQRYKDIFTELGSLIANYLGILNIRYADMSDELLEVDFRVQDSNYPLHVLAVETDSTIEFETVLETLEDEIRILVTVRDGDPETVCAAATDLTSVSQAAFFGDGNKRQLRFTIQKPFLVSEIVEHGGRVVESVASPEKTWIRIALPKDFSVRPLVEFFKTRYSNIELLARRNTGVGSNRSLEQVAEYLTDRQYEIIRAAYYGGYYESPRKLTGEDLADSFQISNTVVHDHIRAGHKRILSHLFDIESENEGLNN